MISVEYMPSTIVGLMTVGLGAIFIYADPHSPTTRALALGSAMLGLAVATGTPIAHRYVVGDIPWPVRLQAIFETGALLAFAEWLIRVARTAETTPRALRRITFYARTTQCLAAMYFCVAVAFPAERLNDFFLSVLEPGVFTRPGFWLFAVLWLIVMSVHSVAGIILFLQPVDPAERVRAMASAASTPFTLGALILPIGYSALSIAFVILVGLVGVVRYLVMQGERGVFMSRFLSPEVARLVRSQGLAATMQPQSLDITVVCCDLRGFTRLSQLPASDQVIRLLNEYYDTVGLAVAEFGGTIKDYAGDGILILVGAPIAAADHAARGLALARQVREDVHAVISRWAGPETILGVGVGVASGAVAVGAVGSAARMEYTAVGPAVNLAARLCQQAKDGDILVDECTTAQAGIHGLESRGSIPLKGFGADVAHYAISNPGGNNYASPMPRQGEGNAAAMNPIPSTVSELRSRHERLWARARA